MSGYFVARRVEVNPGQLGNFRTLTGEMVAPAMRRTASARVGSKRLAPALRPRLPKPQMGSPYSWCRSRGSDPIDER